MLKIRWRYDVVTIDAQRERVFELVRTVHEYPKMLPALYPVSIRETTAS